MHNKIRVEFIPAKKWRELSKWKLIDAYVSHDDEITAPAGFVTNGANIPFGFRSIFSPTGKYFGAAIVHDFMLDTQQGWSKANKAFDKELKSLGIKNWRRKTIMSAVKLNARWQIFRGAKK